MAEYIDKEKFYERMIQKYDDCAGIIWDIEEAPTIEIVRCKDCRYFRKGWTKCKMLNLNGADGDWYCADGERNAE